MGAHNAVRSVESNRLSVNVGSFAVTTNLESTIVARHIFSNSSSSPMTLKQVTANATGASTASATIDIVKCTSGTVPSSGTSMLLTAMNMQAASGFLINSSIGNVSGTQQNVRSDVLGTLSATAANRVLNPGESLAIVPSGTLTGLVGGTVTCWF